MDAKGPELEWIYCRYIEFRHQGMDINIRIATHQAASEPELSSEHQHLNLVWNGIGEPPVDRKGVLQLIQNQMPIGERVTFR